MKQSTSFLSQLPLPPTRTPPPSNIILKTLRQDYLLPSLSPLPLFLFPQNHHTLNGDKQWAHNFQKSKRALDKTSLSWKKVQNSRGHGNACRQQQSNTLGPPSYINF